MAELKQIIVIRTDLDMGRGKMVAQGCHASLDAALNVSASLRNEWLGTGGKKIVVKVSSERELQTLFMEAKKLKLPASIIHDAGHTQVDPGSVTAVAIGPAKESDLATLTNGLKLL
ncbi:aminoacyl-tRNA hydrolase [Candidatus Micrarchaeota archaeon CG1_02_55_22]|nr:MAG: aminoacyl-tRNA hydrolase [Candidatus Micrarchaeota archaeon CG1_02_55_22]